MIALKPVYNRKTKGYDVTVVADANPLYAHQGYLVTDNVAYAILAVEAGRLLQSWSEDKREAVVAKLCDIQQRAEQARDLAEIAAEHDHREQYQD